MRIVLASIALIFSGTVLALDNGMGLTPQMGWNTWNKFGCTINEDLIKSSADNIVKLGLDKLGYTYVNIDDCWMLQDRDAEGHMIPDPATFPSGMKAIGDYIHSKGLKYGIYSSAGTYTCQGRAGSLYHEDIDAQDWASWGVDYLKYDNCYNQWVPATDRYSRMRDALKETDRDIFYSICNWGMEETFKWGPETGNSWRTTMDILNTWYSVQYNFRINDEIHHIAKPGAWNDPDMLEIGNGGLNTAQEKTHFALWAMAKAPLILGCDLEKISKESFEIITNKELIAINQDPLGIQAHCKVNCAKGDWFVSKPQVYAGPLANGDYAIAIVNWGGKDVNEPFEFNFTEIGLPSDLTVSIRDLYEHRDLGEFTTSYKVDTIPAYSTYALRFTPRNQQFLA